MNIKGSNTALTEKLLNRVMEARSDNGAGISFAIIQDNQLLAAGAVGERGKDGTPVEIDDLYNVGSVSKVYTTAAIMRLVDQNKVELDRPCYEYLPKFRMRDERYRDITLRMALDHTSGMSGTNSFNMMGPVWLGEGLMERNYWYWSDSILKADPGSYSVYCNEGFELAAAVIEEVSGLSFGEFLEQEVVRPIGADSTATGQDKLEGRTFMTCVGAEYEFIMAIGAGGVRTNLIDCAKFGNSFLYPGQLLSQASIDEMAKPHGKTFLKKDTLSPGYGLGWDSVHFRHARYDFGDHVLTKGGTTGQFGSFLMVIPKYNMAAALSLCFDTKVVNSELLCELVAMVLKEQGVDVDRDIKEDVAQPIPPEVAEAISGRYYSGMGVYELEVKDDQLITKWYTGNDNWIPMKYFPPMAYNGDTFFGDIYRITTEGYQGRTYLLLYMFSNWMPMLIKAEDYPLMPQPWLDRLGKHYFCVNLQTGNDGYFAMAHIQLESLDDQVLIVSTMAGQPALCCLPDGDDTSVMKWDAPGMGARDLIAPYLFKKDKQEYLTFMSFLYRDADSFDTLKTGWVRNLYAGETVIYKTTAGMKLAYDKPENVEVLHFNDQFELVYEKTSVPEMGDIPDGYIVFASNSFYNFLVKVV